MVVADVLKSGSAKLTGEEALRSPVSSLLGVSSAAQTLLEKFGIKTVFDLAASAIFDTATTLVALETDPTRAEARLNAAASDAVIALAGVPTTELSRQSLTVLTGIDVTRATDITSLLDIRTVRELALWPPYRAARAILRTTFGLGDPEASDLDAPRDLLPTSGVFPSERVFYRRLLIDATPQPAATATPLEQVDAIDINAALASPVAFERLATGALLTFSQSWFSQGLTLGQMLHSLSLAPGESTRIAMIDWTRRTRAAASEDIAEAEQLTNDQTHNRALSEVTSASATEFQNGSSQTTSTSSTGQSGSALGVEIGPLALGSSGGGSSTTTEAMSASSSFGARDLAAQLSQNINDRSQQHASVARTRRASIVREVSQEEHQGISTRVVTNYNHMHALTVQYYEVVQAFRVTTQLDRAERCLFVPLKLLSFKDSAVIDRLRTTLAQAALTPAVFRQLTSEYGVVEIIPQTPRVSPGRVTFSDLLITRIGAGTLVDGTIGTGTVGGSGTIGGVGTIGGGAGVTRAAVNASAVAAGAQLVRYDQGPAGASTTMLAVKGFDVDQLNRLGVLASRAVVRRGSDSAFVPDDALLHGVALRNGQAAKFQVRKKDNSEVAAVESTATSFVLGSPIRFADLQSIGIQNAADTEVRASLVLSVSISGSVVPLDVPIVMRARGAAPVVSEVIRFGAVRASQELIDHLEANRLHYSRAVFRTLDAATIGGLLTRFSFRGLPLTQMVDPQPVAVTANFLVFRLNVPLQGDVDDQRFLEEQTEFNRFLTTRGLRNPAPKTEVIPLPSGGVFAEAVLGRFNSAEKIDLKRFWNWQDSPIPITASEIGPVSAASRAQAEDLRPGQLGGPIVTIQSPNALPAAAGVNPILGAVQNGNIFRDMSGIVATSALAQSGAQLTGAGATASADQAAKNLFTVMDQHTQRLKIAADLLAATAGAPAAGGGGSGAGTPPAGRGTVSERGGQLAKAEELDQQASTGGGPTSVGGAAGGGASGGGVDAISGADAAATPSLQAETLRAQTGGDAAATAARVVDAATREETVPANPRRSSTKPAATATGGAPRVSTPIVRKFRLDIEFGVVTQNLTQGQMRVQATLPNLTVLAEAIGDSRQPLSLFFQTDSPTALLSLKVFTKPGTTGLRLDGFKSLLLPSEGKVTDALSTALGGVVRDRRVLVRIIPVVKSSVIKFGLSGLTPDLDDLERQMLAKGITRDKRIGDPKIDFQFPFAKLPAATVAFFTGELVISEIL